MNTYFNDIKYVFAIGMENISVFKNQNKGRKMLQEIVLPLDELWRRNNIEIKKTVKSLPHDTLPLLYPIERFYYNIFQDGIDFYQCVGRTLFLFYDDKFTKALKKVTSNPALVGKGEFALKTNSKSEKIVLHYYFYDSFHEISFLNLNTNNLTSGEILRDVLSDNKLIPFEYDGAFYLTDNIRFWLIDDDFGIKQIKGENIKLVYDSYFEKRTDFIRNYKANRTKYSVIKKLDGVVIDKNVLKINGYYLTSLKFEKDEFLFRKNDVLKLTEKVNLILKNKGTSPLEVVKLIKQHTNKTLVEAKALMDQDLGVILSKETRENADKIKKILEQTGAVCYIENAFFESEDGSTIANKEGILTFESSDKRIDPFYIPFTLHIDTAMISIKECAGNKYFVSNEFEQENITPEMFTEKYLKPFILNIVHHGA